MPEGHTLHALAGRLGRAFASTAVEVSSPQGRFTDGAALLDGRVLRGASAWGKHLFAEFEGDAWLHVHLGLIGKFAVHRRRPADGAPPGHEPVQGQVRLRLLNDRYVGDLRGPNLCAVVTPEDVEAVHARLGPDPLRPGADPDVAWRKISRSQRTVAELLMDQTVLAGVGNVYRCELLFRHRVDPFRPGREVRAATWRAVWDDLARLMPLGVVAGQILTLEEQVDAAVAELESSGRITPPERAYYVYRRSGEPCRLCGAKVRTELVAGRNLFWCGRCQRRR
jgi:endonuclease VIII